MFDIGFTELVLIAIVALIVVGPERLPGAIRTASLWIGRAKRSFNQVKAEIEREINTDEIRRQLHNESIMADLEKAKKKADSLVMDTQKHIAEMNAEVNATLKEEEAKKPDTANTAPQQANVQPAATEPDPARFDEDYVEPQAVVPSTPESAPAPAAPAAPVEDFYNNPPSGVIELRGGVFRPVAVEPDTDKNQQGQS